MAERVWRRQPAVGLALAAVAGVFIADRAGVENDSIALAAFVLSACAALLVRKSVAVYLCVAAAFFCVHSMRLNGARRGDLANFIPNEPTAVTANGIVISEPRLSVRGTATFTLGLRSVDIDGLTHRTSAAVLARWRNNVRYGDELNLFGTLEPVDLPRNPGEFDMRAFLARQEITRQLIVRYPENGRLVRHTNGNLVLATAYRARETLQRILCRGLDDSPDVEAAIVGMSLGIRHQTPQDVEEPFQQTGTLHLFAVAGLHVGIVAQLLWIVARLLRLPRRSATVAIIIALLFYSAVTGLHTSSVRASIMAAVLLAGFLVERRVFALNSLAAAAVIILGWNTNELFSIGFQMSFAVVGAIILVAEPTFRLLLRLAAPDPLLPQSLFSPLQRAKQTAWRWFARGLSVSFGAWIGSLVPMYVYWNLITPISLIANLAVVPIAFFVLAGALLSAIAAPISTWLSVVFNNSNWLLTRLVLALVHLFAQLPTGHWYLEHPHRLTHPLLDMTALDVGTGGAIHLRTRKRDWLIDAAARRNFDKTTRQYLRYRGTNRLDALVLTHADANHIGGAPDVIDAFDPRLVLNTAARSRSALNRAVQSKITREHLPHAFTAAGDVFRFDQHVTARVLFPPAKFEAASADDQALVLQLLVDGKSRVLLMSDSGEATERALLANPSELRADILVKGQNRTGISGTAELIDAVEPKVIVATSSDFPENERIKAEWAALLTSRGIKLLRQDFTGAVRLLFYGDHWEARPYLSSEILRSSNR